MVTQMSPPFNGPPGIFHVDLGHPKPSCEICRGSGTVQCWIWLAATCHRTSLKAIGPTPARSAAPVRCHTSGSRSFGREMNGTPATWGDEGFIKHIRHGMAHDLAETMLKDGYVHFDDRPSDPMTIAYD
jgi:hypothetical protein